MHIPTTGVHHITLTGADERTDGHVDASSTDSSYRGSRARTGSSDAGGC